MNDKRQLATLVRQNSQADGSLVDQMIQSAGMSKDISEIFYRQWRKYSKLEEGCQLNYMPLFYQQVFDLFDKNEMALIITAILTEKNIIVHSKNLKVLTGFLMCLRECILPLQVQSLFIPILPLHMLDIILAPIPVIIGLPSDEFEKINTPDGYWKDCMKINLDERNIDCFKSQGRKDATL